jgi:hypothetical protein
MLAGKNKHARNIFLAAYFGAPSLLIYTIAPLLHSFDNHEADGAHLIGGTLDASFAAPDMSTGNVDRGPWGRPTQAALVVHLQVRRSGGSNCRKGAKI